MLSLITISVLLGLGLAADAFSVSLANGLNEPGMKLPKLFGVSLTFALFQAAMPMIGWICVHTVLEHFSAFEKFIPWIALALLGYIGTKMLIEGLRCPADACKLTRLTLGALIVQGIATSIDALSVGFTIAGYSLANAIIAVLIIGVVTFVTCTAGLFIGRKFGTKLAGKAGILGGVILIGIGIEIFIKGVFFS